LLVVVVIVLPPRRVYVRLPFPRSFWFIVNDYTIYSSTFNNITIITFENAKATMRLLMASN
jgi:hypothetical protein